MKDVIDNETIDKLNTMANELEASSENNIDNGDRKIDGAIAEVLRRAELDKTVEDSLSTGLNNSEFKAASQKIDKKRKVYTSNLKSTLKLKKNSLKSTLKLKNAPTAEEVVSTFVLDDEYRQSMKELEEEISDSLNKKVYSQMAEMNRVLLLDYLVDNHLDQEKSEIINIGFASDGNYNVVAFSDTGYLMQLINKEEVKIETGFDIKNEKSEYNLIAPDGTVLAKKMKYEEALEGLAILSNGYLKSLKEENNVANQESVDFEQPVQNIDQENKQETVPALDKYVLDNLGGVSKQALEAVLPEKSTNSNEIRVWNFEDIVDPLNFVSFSSVGYISQLANRKEIENENGFNAKSDNAKYNLIAPDGQIVKQNIELEEADELLWSESEKYLEKIKKELFHLENNLENKPDDEIPVVDSSVDNSVADNSTENNLETATHNPEFEPSILFNKYLISKLGGLTKIELTSYLENKDLKRDKVLAWDFRKIIGADIVSFSSVGYMTQLINKNEVQESDCVNIYSEKARYNLIAPSGEIVKQDISYYESQRLIYSESKNYLSELNKEFEVNKENIKKDFNYSESEESKDSFINPFNKNVSGYAENIGIDIKELATNSNFVELLPEQQQFVLETLRRSSLAKAKVEGYKSFTKEKESKKIWQIGFSLNQNYHKERHKIEALKNIERQGLAGYGEDELNWLIEVMKNGPEIKINEDGEIRVDCLKEEYFNEEQKALVTEYNNVAREYIELSKDKDPRVNLLRCNAIKRNLNEISSEIINKQSDGNVFEINQALFKAKNNVELLRFLSADQETERLLDKMAATSFSGMDKAKAMIGAQKDKAGYAALGFTLRTGTKFALANSACLASAISYSVGPMVAAIVGGFRGHNMGKKELIEKEELAKLGIKDNSKTAKSLNLAAGKKENVNFGLTEKLQVLVDKLKDLKASNNEEGVENVVKELRLRIDYTESRIENGSVDYGPVEERNGNYFNLVNTLAEAKSLIGELAAYKRISNYWVYNSVKKLTRDNSGKNNFKEISEIGAYDRLASFMNYQEQKQNKKELNFLIKKTATGAIMGATFAAAGAFIAEKLGVSEWLSDHLNKDSFRKVGDSFESLFSNKNNTSQEAAANLTNLSHRISTEEIATNVKSDTAVEQVAPVAKPNAVTQQTETAPTSSKTTSNLSNANSKIRVEETAAPAKSNSVVEQVQKTNITSKTERFVDEISNKGINGKSDSVWRSTREIFKNNAYRLGYKGDLNDQAAVNHWAELQTAKTISNSGEINDKIFEGNKVVLTKSGDDFTVNIEQGEGLKPEQLNHNVSPASSRQETINNNPVVEHQSSSNSQPVFNSENIEQNDVESYSLESADQNNWNPINNSFDNPTDSIATNDLNDQENSFDQKFAQIMADKKSVIVNNLKIKPESLQQSGNAFVYDKGFGKININFINNNIEVVFTDKNGSTVPESFISDLKGKTPLDKFLSKDLDKTFKVWNNLSNDDRSLYQILNGKTTKNELLNQIKIQFKLNDNVKLTTDNKFAVTTGENRQEYFDQDFKGVKRMLKVLADLPK